MTTWKGAVNGAVVGGTIVSGTIVGGRVDGGRVGYEIGFVPRGAPARCLLLVLRTRQTFTPRQKILESLFLW